MSELAVITSMNAADSEIEVKSNPIIPMTTLVHFTSYPPPPPPLLAAL